MLLGKGGNGVVPIVKAALDWPEMTQTSPKSTSCSVIVLGVLSAELVNVMAYAV